MVGPVMRAIVYTLASASPDTVASQHENIRPASSGPGTPTALTRASSSDSVLATERLLRSGALGVNQDGRRLGSRQGEDSGSEAFEDESTSSSVEECDLDSLDDGFMLPPPQLDLDCEDSAMPLPKPGSGDDLLLPMSSPRDRGLNEASRCVAGRAGGIAACSATVRTSPSSEPSFRPPRGMVGTFGDEVFATKVLPYLALVDVGATLSCGRGISRHALELFWKQLLRDRFVADSALVQVALRLLVASRAHKPALCSLVSVVSQGLHVQQGSPERTVQPPQPTLAPVSTVSSWSSAETIFLDDGFALPPPALGSAAGTPPLFPTVRARVADFHDEPLGFSNGRLMETDSLEADAVFIPAAVHQGAAEESLPAPGDDSAPALLCDRGLTLSRPPSEPCQPPPPPQPPHCSQQRTARLPQPAAWAAGQRRRAARRGVRRRPATAQRPRAHTLLPSLLDGVAFGSRPQGGSRGRGPAGRGERGTRGGRRGGGKLWQAGCHGPGPSTTHASARGR